MKFNVDNRAVVRSTALDIPGMRRALRRLGVTGACAVSVLTTAPSVRAAELGQLAAHYTTVDDADYVDIADVTISVVTPSSPRLLEYLGQNIRYDFTVGTFFDADGDNVPFAYAGPTWEYHPDFLWSGSYVEFGSALTYLGHSHVNDKNLGGHFQFTSHVTLGHRFGVERHWRVGVRIQHTSNAALENPNPGLDAALVELGYGF